MLKSLQILKDISIIFINICKYSLEVKEILDRMHGFVESGKDSNKGQYKLRK